MILVMIDKKRVLNEQGEAFIHHLNLKPGIGEKYALAIFAQYDENEIFAYAYARLNDYEVKGDKERWNFSILRPFVAERQLGNDVTQYNLADNTIHVLHDDLPAAKEINRAFNANSFVECVIAHEVLDETVWIDDLLLRDRRITAEYTDQDLIRSAHKMAEQVRAFAADMEGFEDYFENYVPEPDPDEWNPTEEEIAEVENTIMQILTDPDHDNQ